MIWKECYSVIFEKKIRLYKMRNKYDIYFFFVMKIYILIKVVEVDNLKYLRRLSLIVLGSFGKDLGWNVINE